MCRRALPHLHRVVTMTPPNHNAPKNAPVSRWRRLGEQEIELPIGRKGCAVSWLGLQAAFIFIASLICSCCALSAYGWGVVSSRFDPSSIAGWPAPFSRPTVTSLPPTATLTLTLTLTQTVPTTPFATVTPLSATPPGAPPVTPSATWTSPLATPAAPSPTPPAPSPEGEAGHSDVRIVYVEYAPAESEDWEFVLIENRGPGDQDMSNWTLSNERGDAYTFPKGFILPVDGSVRVWTKNGQDSEIELYWGREEEAWDNTSDTATLRDGDGKAVDWRSWSAP